MQCEHPITLKSGLVVPCGKCLLCLSSRRDEWSRRLQLHTYGYTKKPIFITLTYDHEHVNMNDNGMTLCKKDIQLFIKCLKDRDSLYNSDFSFFGCGEYGDAFGRPHCHLLIFGAVIYNDMYDRGYDYLRNYLEKVWKKGNVDVGLAGFDGIHYVTKYVLKYDKPAAYEGLERPFIVSSNGLGLPWLNRPEARLLKHRLRYYKTPSFHLDGSDLHSLRDSAVEAYNMLLEDAPRLLCTLPSGERCSIPRYLRKKLVGSFEHFSDNPLWVLNHVKMIADSCNYYINHPDEVKGVEYSTQILNFAKRKIRQRLIINNQL